VTSEAEHLAQARANLNVLRFLLDDADIKDGARPQWIITIAFYTVVHCIEARLRSEGIPKSTQHRERGTQLMRSTVPPDIVDSYMQLKQWSESARYDLATFDMAFVRTSVLAELRNVLTLVSIHDLDDTA
jgi:hypothetical protein